MDTEGANQQLRVEGDGSRNGRGGVLTEEENPSPTGKKPKGDATEDLTMDEEMNEDDAADSGGRNLVHLIQDVKMTEGSGGNRARVVSYKDKLLKLNGNGGQSDTEDDNWILQQKHEDEEADRLEGLGQIEEEDPLCPRYTFSAEEHKQDCEKWRKALIIKMLGKRIEFKFLLSRLQRIWNLVSSYEAIDLDNGFLLLRFQEDGDYRHVLEEGPWIVNDHYVVIQRWRPLFDPYDDSVKKLAVWVRILGLPIELYTIRHLWRIGNIFGRTLKVDRNSLRKSEFGEDVITERARFARICVEVDLRKTFLPKFWIGNKVYQVGYEGLHLICFKCGVYGHRKDQCPIDQVHCTQQEMETVVQGKKVTEDVISDPKIVKEDEAFGNWMVIQRQPKSRKLKAKPLSPVKGAKVEPKLNSDLGGNSSSGMVTKINLDAEMSGMDTSNDNRKDLVEVGCVTSSVVGGVSLVADTNIVVASQSPQKSGRATEVGVKKSLLKEGKDRSKTGIKSQKKYGVENVPPYAAIDGSIKGLVRNKSRYSDTNPSGGGMVNTSSRKEASGVLYFVLANNASPVSLKDGVSSSKLVDGLSAHQVSR
ncbi:uncharacterized protein LOC133307173 [Gastrolobium bilobum]|uniref:uncharacterized protein LOC133307173 n=1 Tax=Gastrolobium bilobum TaxID=150636 RepID=UPI002AB186E9|nr:uncharacterized protein LOC133307173 [Gastrolobium bilobum]